uniref:Uncharacterized protein n=1 Tax=Siphoviridae sp. ct1E017 TaxID=2827764 RepID=A0A8S5T1D1_9CAUD|nr:MAG TPA: hypothetical protein [Siphoviridae sp. ct1E017]
MEPNIKSEHPKHPLKKFFKVCIVLLALLVALSIFRGSSFARSFRGRFMTSGSDFFLAYTYTSGLDTRYLLFASDTNAVWLTSSRTGNACLTTYQGSSLANGIDSVFYYSDGTCHRNFKYQDSSDDSVLLVTETYGGSLPKVLPFEKADLETAKTALDEMKTVYDVSKP